MSEDDSTKAYDEWLFESDVDVERCFTLETELNGIVEKKRLIYIHFAGPVRFVNGKFVKADEEQAVDEVTA